MIIIPKAVFAYSLKLTAYSLQALS